MRKVLSIAQNMLIKCFRMCLNVGNRFNCNLYRDYILDGIPLPKVIIIYCLTFCPVGTIWWDGIVIIDSGNGLLARYAKLRVAHAPGMPRTYSPPPRVNDPDMHHGTCVMHVQWCMLGSLTSGFLCSQWRGKRFRHSRRMRKPPIRQEAHAQVLTYTVVTLRIWDTEADDFSMNMAIILIMTSNEKLYVYTYTCVCGFYTIICLVLNVYIK